VEASLIQLGYELTGPVEQFRNWSISSLLRAPAAQGTVYFKAAAGLPLFVNEPALMESLACLYPRHIPSPLRIDPLRRWLLIADFGLPLREQPDGDLAPVLRVYGEMQRDTVQHVDALRAAGVHDRRLPILAAQIDPLLNASITRESVAADDLAALVQFAPRLRALCHELAAYNIPATLVHGDLHLGNVAEYQGDYIFYDWTDACIGHPFFDMLTPYFYVKDEAEGARLRDVYLAVWAAYEPPDRLLAAWAMAKPLAALHQAVSYLSIVQHLEPLVQGELSDGLHDFLGEVLAYLRA
jgi:hypothetical protein